MFTYKFYIDTKRNDSLMLRITNNRKKSELSMGFQLTEDDLADAMSSKPELRNCKYRNMIALWTSRIETIRVDLATTGRANEDVKEIKKMIADAFSMADKVRETKRKGDFTAWFTKFADTHTTPGAKTRKDYLHTLKRLRDCFPDIDTYDFADVTVARLEEFDEFLAKTCKLNSRNHHMRNIRAVFKYALRHDLDIRNPFDRMKLKTEETAKRSLTVDELREVFTMKIEPYAEIYRDMFRLSFMLIGINPIDLYRLSSISSNGRIEYRRAKTHKLYSIKVEPEAMEIIEKYRGQKNLLMLADRWKLSESFGAAANTALGYLGSLHEARGRKKSDTARFPDLTLYWARHTWSTIAADLDIPDAAISLALGHSGENKVTDIYIRRNQKKVDRANRMVLDWVLYGKKTPWSD